MSFSDFKEEYLRSWAAYEPMSAFGSGRREYASLLPDHRIHTINSRLAHLDYMLQKLHEFSLESLDEIDQMDYEIIENHIDSIYFTYKVLESHRTNPLFYTSPAFIFEYLLKDYAPLIQRMVEMTNHLLALPDYYDVAKSNLDFSRVAKENNLMATQMLSGMIPFLENIRDETMYFDENATLDEATLSTLEDAAQVAKRTIADFVEYLKTNHESCAGSFRLGRKKFSQMLKMVERVDVPVENILEKGMANLEHNLKEMKRAASEIDSNRKVVEILEEVKKNHPTTESLISDTQAMLEEIKQFLITSEFVSVPSDVMPQVVPTPKPFRNWAFAAMDTPGALERKATDSYYYITPPADEWTDEEKEEWLETFNYKQLLDISVHEAFPGHFLHSLHNARSRSIMAKLFGAYHFWEGYALYVEEAMYQHGFHKEDYQYRMAQLSETLIRNVRLVCAMSSKVDYFCSQVLI